MPGDLASDSGWNAPYSWLNDVVPVFQGGGDVKRQYDWTVVGQSIFTPQRLHTTAPVANDRPYGAWLYTGASILQQDHHESHDTLENAEVLGGVVGPEALGGIVQNDFHQFIGVQAAEGWTNQIHTEPGFVFTYERKWRFEAPLSDSYLGADVIPEAGASLGNIFTYGEMSAQMRIGHNLKADYGTDHIRPSLSGTGFFDEAALMDKLGWYLFVGAQGRAVGHNIFLDGNTYSSSPSVDKKPLVDDLVAGASVFWSRAMRVDFTVTQRSKEFYGQQGHPDRFGSIGFTSGF